VLLDLNAELSSSGIALRPGVIVSDALSGFRATVSPETALVQTMENKLKVDLENYFLNIK
jgi:hypothetical protein